MPPKGKGVGFKGTLSTRRVEGCGFKGAACWFIGVEMAYGEGCQSKGKASQFKAGKDQFKGRVLSLRLGKASLREG